ncbi:hypothetical protein [Pseudodesulfovibrio indicus]|uniref:hypothetical protein n=1 Tax=Pseudodesulfovibrio indicus TaxID=1716143 RepID=UPI00292E77DF|nr:hypothetical protein [Pseudodesulfovibrio indicus]
MVQDKFISHLKDNSLYFFEKAMSLFNEDPKLSAVCFSTALELMLKARLAHDHWSLVFDKPENAKLEDAKSGDFISAGPREVIRRLEGISNVIFLDEEKAAYFSLIKRRNAIVHFSEELITKEERERIISTAYQAVYHMHEMMSDSWSDLFSDKKRELWRLSTVLKNFQPYLKQKLKAIKPKLDEAKKAGATVTNCSRCGLKSAVSTKAAEDPCGTLIYVNCLVCSEFDNYLIYNCHNCDTQNIFIGEGDSKECTSCGGILSAESISDDKSNFDRDTFEDDLSYCILCEHHEKHVIPFGDDFLCLNCLELHDTVEFCENCGEPNAGFDAEGSIFSGCVMCEGRDF